MTTPIQRLLVEGDNDIHVIINVLNFTEWLESVFEF